MSEDPTWRVTENHDTGSLRTGDEKLEAGDRIQIDGEVNLRRVTYVMGSEANGWHANFAGQGSVPQGQVRWRVVAQAKDGQGVNGPRMKDISSADLSRVTRGNVATGEPKEVQVARI